MNTNTLKSVLVCQKALKTVILTNTLKTYKGKLKNTNNELTDDFTQKKLGNREKNARLEIIFIDILNFSAYLSELALYSCD